MAKSESKFRFYIIRLRNFLWHFIKNKRGITGLVIICFFIVLAIAAPIIAPYDHLGRDPSLQGYLAGKRAAPSWLRRLPSFLGGNPDLSENMIVIQNPGSPKIWPEGEWNVSKTSDSITLYYDENVNFPSHPIPEFKFEDVQGALAITFRRKNVNAEGNVSVVIYKIFDYPYSGIPYGLVGNLEILVNGTTYEGDILHVPLKVRVFFGLCEDNPEKAAEEATTLFPPIYKAGGATPPPYGFTIDPKTGEPYITKRFSGREGDDFWILSRYSKDSQFSLIGTERIDKVQALFPKMPGRYVYGLEVVFMDNSFSNETVSSTVYIDDFALKIYGTCFGLLGTDNYGRDLFSQLIYGTRVSLFIGLSVSIISVIIGLLVGLAAGYLGGAADQFLMRFNDLMLVIPGLPLLIVLVAVLGAKIENLIILLGFLGWNGFARMVRSQVLSLKERPFVETAIAVGASRKHIIFRHILPNVMSLVYVSLATSVPGAITAEASLSWLGFYDYNRMSWGRMLHDVFAAGAITNWWWIIPPGLCISLLAVSFILLGFALDEILNPKLRLRR